MKEKSWKWKQKRLGSDRAVNSVNDTVLKIIFHFIFRVTLQNDIKSSYMLCANELFMVCLMLRTIYESVKLSLRSINEL